MEGRARGLVCVTSRLCCVCGENALQRLRQAGVDVVCIGGRGSGNLLDVLKEADAVIASTEAYSRDILEHLTKLRIIARWGVGYDSIDLEAATELGIVVTFTPEFIPEAVADLVFGLMIALARKLVDTALSMREGKWEPKVGVSVWGKTLGIIGCGRIGIAVARRALGFGMRVLGYDIVRKQEALSIGVEFVSLDELLMASDFVSINVPLSDSTIGMIGERELRLMKPSAFLINTSRGLVVDELALLKALREGWIAGAALDVYSVEPLPSDHPLRKMPNCICTPHIGTHDSDTARLVSELAVDCVISALKGEIPKHVVNEDVLKRGNLRISVMPPLL